MDDQAAYERARKAVEEKLGFYRHLGTYVVINILLIIINLTTSADYLWFKWPLLGWGIGVAFHGLKVFVFPGHGSFKERMIREQMEKDARQGK